MGKKRPPRPDESQLFVRATPSSSVPIIDTHTHLHSTFQLYKEKYAEGVFSSLPKSYEFVRGAYEGRNVQSIVDVFCEAAEVGNWRELADSAATPELREENWAGIDYWFVMGEYMSVSSKCLRTHDSVLRRSSVSSQVYAVRQLPDEMTGTNRRITMARLKHECTFRFPGVLRLVDILQD